MKLYLLSQKHNTGYDTYDSCIVCAKDEQDARTIYPSEYVTHIKDKQWMGTYGGGNREGDEYQIDSTDWVPYSMIDQIKVTYLGEANPLLPRGVVLASFNAG